MTKRRPREGLDFLRGRDGSVTHDPCTIGAYHPASSIIEEMLVRRGDHPAVARGRGIAIAEMLIRAELLKAPERPAIVGAEKPSEG